MIELSDLIRDLRHELAEAVRSAPPDGLRFALGSIEVEVEVAVENRTDGRGGIRFWVLELGGDASRTSASTQRIKLSLHPQVGASGRTPYVSGPELDRES